MLRKLLLKVEGSADYCFSVDFDKRPNSYIIKPGHHSVYGWNVNSTAGRTERLMKHFDKQAEIIFRSGGAGHIACIDYARPIPQPLWKFWDDVPDEKVESID
jgi:hypothetical protein